jgi:hypothetical protein
MADTKTDGPPETVIPSPELLAGLAEKSLAEKQNPKPKEEHPSGKESYGTLMQVVRGSLFALYFNSCCIMYERRASYQVQATNMMVAFFLPSLSALPCTSSIVTGTTLTWL